MNTGMTIETSTADSEAVDGDPSIDVHRSTADDTPVSGGSDAGSEVGRRFNPFEGWSSERLVTFFVQIGRASCRERV